MAFRRINSPHDWHAQRGSCSSATWMVFVWPILVARFAKAKLGVRGPMNFVIEFARNCNYRYKYAIAKIKLRQLQMNNHPTKCLQLPAWDPSNCIFGPQNLGLESFPSGWFREFPRKAFPKWFFLSGTFRWLSRRWINAPCFQPTYQGWWETFWAI